MKEKIDLKAMAKDMVDNPDSPENLAVMAQAKALAQHRDNQVAADIVVNQIDNQFRRTYHGRATILSWDQWQVLRKILRPGAEGLK